MVHNVLIIGSGPAGLTAGIYTARASLKPVLFEGFQAGGQLMITSEVENFPGFPDGIQGPQLMMNMKEQAKKLGTNILSEDVSSVDFSQKPFKVNTSSNEYFAHSVIIATGASAKWLGLESEKRLIGSGVSACAVCDAFFYKNKKVVVIGGGDSAIEEALYLTKFAAEVKLLHRRDKLRGSKIMQYRALSNPKLSVIWNSTIVDILDSGTNKVTGIRIKDVITNKESDIETNGVFVAIGHEPNTAFLNGQLEIDKANFIVTREGTKTSIEGVFAAGDVQDHIFKQAVTAAGTGCMAALQSEKYLVELGLI